MLHPHTIHRIPNTTSLPKYSNLIPITIPPFPPFPPLAHLINSTTPPSPPLNSLSSDQSPIIKITILLSPLPSLLSPPSPLLSPSLNTSYPPLYPVGTSGGCCYSVTWGQAGCFQTQLCCSETLPGPGGEALVSGGGRRWVGGGLTG